MHIHVTGFMWQNGLLCAHYVDQKWAVWRLFWANFAVVGAMKFPFALFRPDMARKCDMRCTRAFVGAAPNFFALQALHSGRFALFCRKQGAFMWVYVAVSRSDFYVFLRESPYRDRPMSLTYLFCMNLRHQVDSRVSVTAVWI